MYPAQTSLIPVQIALARFLESFDRFGKLTASGLRINTLLGNYPYWYLGTTPYRYLTGPVLPLILVGLHKVFSFLSLFEIMFGVIGISWVMGGIGVYLLVRELEGISGNSREYKGERKISVLAVIAAVFYVFGPMVPFLFRFSDGLYLITFSLLPFTLLMYFRLLRRWERKTALFCTFLITFLLLLDSLIIPTLILGMAAVFLAQGSWKRTEEKLKQTFLILAFSFLICTLWYTPGYWLTLLGAPSLAGKGLAGVIVWLGKLLPAALAFGIALVSVKFFKKRHLPRDFCFYWLFIFGFISLLRFLSDPDFWLDWSVYGTELQFGLAIAMGLIITQIAKVKAQNDNLKLKTFLLLGTLSAFYFLLFIFIFDDYVLGTLQSDITQTVEYRTGKELDARVKEQESGRVKRVFLSGTTVFWLNAFFDIPQVRGGIDQASVDPRWRQAAWEIREGASLEKSVQWLKMLKITYLVVHTQDSEEFYHDFAYPEKFEAAFGLEKIYDQEGDRIYQIEK